MKNKIATVLKPNYYGLNHTEVKKQFEGNLSFVNDFCVNGEYLPVAVYKAKTPNIKKGHKKYMLLVVQSNSGVVRGMSAQEMKKHRTQEAVLCNRCKYVIYSVNRHHYACCDCDKHPVSIDGGKDYTKIGFSNTADYTLGTLDLITDKFTPFKNKKSKS